MQQSPAPDFLAPSKKFFKFFGGGEKIRGGRLLHLQEKRHAF